ncbi:LutC/YkgG family protein [Tunturiibacter gelidoferens]|jgi:L-lactate dehydrogenase complex protein LldG|uniref:L-lactate dehydrogenase complex protein LldG n=1 Tax=Tunturiibacter gelidiferens TaxID=3069689 RepID=A0A9X0QBS3_9BACT|nr:LUD domain-containing protein [Edaphobacter lichenicola]MBB5327467.1 L-lactate dehydrogenase complex protein LldG [Edaphobacter lichenicola]
METTSSREVILKGIRYSNLFLIKQEAEAPQIPVFQRADTPLKPEFEVHLQKAGGVAHDVSSVAEVETKLAVLHPEAMVICSAVPEIAGTRKVTEVHDPHELADVDVGIVRAQFGVAESGAVWLTQEDLVVDALGFLSQHLIVLLDPNEIVSDMHAAYLRVRLDETAFGCFMMGPSATADVEATLVHGAQGARSLNIFFLPPM